MEDNTKKIMLATSVLGSLLAVSLGYKYYYCDNSCKSNDTNENRKERDNKSKYKTLGTELKELSEINENFPKGERTKYRTGFINDMIQTITFRNKPEKVKIDIKEKSDDDDTWPTFN